MEVVGVVSFQSYLERETDIINFPCSGFLQVSLSTTHYCTQHCSTMLLVLVRYLLSFLLLASDDEPASAVIPTATTRASGSGVLSSPWETTIPHVETHAAAARPKYTSWGAYETSITMIHSESSPHLRGSTSTSIGSLVEHDVPVWQDETTQTEESNQGSAV